VVEFAIEPRHRLEIDVDESDDEKPAKKKKAGTTVADYFDKVPKALAPTARKTSGSKPPAKKGANSKAAASDDSDGDDDGPVVVPARSAPARTSRVAAKKSYVEVGSEIEEVQDAGSSFAMDD
jgi:hypothetical protein